MAPQGTRAIDALRRAGVAHLVVPYEAPDPARGGRDGRPAYGADAAMALGIAPDRICKTLVVSADGELVLAVVPVASQRLRRTRDDILHLLRGIGYARTACR